jgi:uncharacterized protein (DUF2384 family)
MIPAATESQRISGVYSRTEPGAREVENLIGQLEQGIFA